MKRLALLALVLAFQAVPASSSSAGVARRGNVVMGTVLTVTVVADTTEAAASMAEAALAEAARWDDALTIWRPEGELALFNAAAGRGAVAVSPRLVAGLAAMLELSAATSGAFDPAIGSLQGDDGRAGGVEGIATALVVTGQQARMKAGSALDPGAIGKGLAIDAIVSLLRERGALSAFVDFGGSSQTSLGAPPGDAEGWSVLIAALAPATSHGVLKLRDASVSTSKAGATETRPILDPRSGRPAPGPRLVTAKAARAADADAWSTALVVDGRPGLEGAKAAGVLVLLEDSDGTVIDAGLDLVPAPSAAGGGGKSAKDR